MKRKTRFFMWYIMLSKRLLKRWSFVILLLIIPLIIPAFNVISSDDGGVVKVAIYAPGEGLTDEIASSMLKKDSVVDFVRVATREEANELVKKGKCHAAWIFDTDFEQKMEEYVSENRFEPFVTVVEQEDNIFLMLSREELHGALYPHVSFEIYSNFVRKEIGRGREIDDDILREHYSKREITDSILQIKMAGSGKIIDIGDMDYLKTPLRGLMSLVVMLCGFAAAGFFMKERNNGIYDWMNSGRMLVPAFGSCFAAILMAAFAVIISIFIGGLSNGVLTEIGAMTCFVMASTGFCLVICSVFSRFESFGPMIPFMMIGMLVLCPIFFTLDVLMPIRMILPPYYYLMSIHNHEYMAYMLIYSVICLMLAYVLGRGRVYKAK